MVPKSFNMLCTLFKLTFLSEDNCRKCAPKKFIFVSICIQSMSANKIVYLAFINYLFHWKLGNWNEEKNIET